MKRTQSIVYGGLGGLAGAGCMTFVRSLGHRAGLFERTAPQGIEEALAEQPERTMARGPMPHHLADQLLHMGYAAALGAAYGAVAGAPRRPLRGGLLVGFGAWLGGSWVIVPALGAAPPPWRRSGGENLIDLAAHLLFGLTTTHVRRQFLAQPGHGPRPRRQRMATSTG
jgi:hypothetical protein